MLLDDITSILDDVAILTKVAAKKTAGVLGDDLALNAQQVTGVDASRELPVVWAVAKGSLVNKAILVPVALALSTLAPWAIQPLLILGGLFLCYEGCEKLAHRYLHPAEDDEHLEELHTAMADPSIDLVEVEKGKIRGAIRTDFVLSAEIIVITLGTVAQTSFMMQVAVLVSIALLMTVGVYGLVAGIVKLDDLGMRLLRSNTGNSSLTFKQSIGQAILTAAPYLMKTLSVVGTAAMFLVGGSILVHGVPPVHHAIEAIVHPVANIVVVGGFMSTILNMALEGLAGLLGGAIVLAIVTLGLRLFKRQTPGTPT